MSKREPLTRNRRTAIFIFSVGLILMLAGIVMFYSGNTNLGIVGIVQLGVGSILLTFGSLFGLGKRDGI
jgi:hypothetical protein